MLLLVLLLCGPIGSCAAAIPQGVLLLLFAALGLVGAVFPPFHNVWPLLLLLSR